MPPDRYRRKRGPALNALEGAKSKIAQSAWQVPVAPGRTATPSARCWRPVAALSIESDNSSAKSHVPARFWSRFAQHFVTQFSVLGRFASARPLLAPYRQVTGGNRGSP